MFTVTLPEGTFRVLFSHHRKTDSQPDRTYCCVQERCLVSEALVQDIERVNSTSYRIPEALLHPTPPLVPCFVNKGVMGYAWCSPRDQFTKETGRKIALARAIAGFPRTSRTLIWKTYHARHRPAATPHGLVALTWTGQGTLALPPIY